MHPLENQIKSYECDIWRRQFSKLCVFNMYKSTHTGAYECEVCKKRFLRLSTLVKHKRCHPELSKSRYILPKPLTPLMKETAFSEPKHVYVPIESKVRLYECDICKRRFSTSAAYGGHRKVHYKKYQCNVCNKAFSNLSDYAGHKKSHPFIKRIRKILPKPLNGSEKSMRPPEQANFFSTDHGESTPDPLDNRQSLTQIDNALAKMRYILPKQSPVPQNITPKPVEQSINGNSTVLISNNAVDNQPTDKTNHCDVYLAKFSDLPASNADKKVHPILFECDVCEKSFLFSRSLEVHKLEHVAEPKYECDVCKKTFTTSTTLQKHRRAECKPYGCNICTSKFPNIESHKFHLMRYHRDEAICKTCGKELSGSQILQEKVGVGDGGEVLLKFAHPILDKNGNVVSYQCSFCQEIETSDDTWSVCSLCGCCCGNFKELQDHMCLHKNDVEKEEVG
ncbi:zinc finger protein 271-like [Dendronephthya gigantea]|uniref:zinc finger protein 271-like n=1 Tax=Dendronephthya gigantea TaxID=151771 RepID=UPI00106D7235|nr:zinc finger protein 271-like [Dendronephthya gigantea]XP_028415732.1 zinc finger protein 271-like [Dendronephthya gigantea]